LYVILLQFLLAIKCNVRTGSIRTLRVPRAYAYAYVRAGQLYRDKLQTYTTLEPSVVCGIRGSESAEALKDVRVRTRAKNRGEDEKVEKEQEKASSQGRRRCEVNWRQKTRVEK